jgi:hypothetical protein
MPSGRPQNYTTLTDVTHVFMLHDHPLKEINGKRFLIETVTHSAEVFVEDSDPDFDLPRASRYFNEFTALWRETPADQYRPKRVTPKPTIPGVISARIDAEGSGVRAELDEHGRYRVRQFKDLRDETDGKASNPIRKAETFGGKGYGVHFPLLKGAEVLLSFENGDPDRPIITGVVSNPHQPSQVKRPNQTMNRLLTPSGVTMETQDGSLSRTEDSESSSPSQVYTRIEVPGDGDDAPPKAYVRAGDHDANDSDIQKTIAEDTHRGKPIHPNLERALKDNEKETDAESIPPQGLYFATGHDIWQQVAKDHVSDIGGDRISVVKGHAYEIIRGGETRIVRAADDDAPVLSRVLGSLPFPTDLPADPWSLISFQQSFVDPLLGLPVSQSVGVGASIGLSIGNMTKVKIGETQTFSLANTSTVGVGLANTFTLNASQTVKTGLSGETALSGSSTLKIGANYTYALGANCDFSGGIKKGFVQDSWSQEAFAPVARWPIHLLSGYFVGTQLACSIAANTLGILMAGGAVTVAAAANLHTGANPGDQRRGTNAAALVGLTAAGLGMNVLASISLIMQICATVVGIVYMKEIRKTETKGKPESPDAEKASDDLEKAKTASSTASNPIAGLMIEVSKKFAEEVAKQSANAATPGIGIEAEPPSVQIGFKNGNYIFITPAGVQIRSLTTDIVSPFFRSWGNRQHVGPHHTAGPTQIDGILNVAMPILAPVVTSDTLVSPKGAVAVGPVLPVIPLPPPIMPPDPKPPAT